MIYQRIHEVFNHQASPWIPLDQALEILLYDPHGGYYQQQNPFGREGDFVTAPDISPLFGEMLGIWALNQWQEAGQPFPLRLIELGPGRGRMMSQILGLFRKLSPLLFPQAPSTLLDHTTVHLIEVSSRLKEKQRQALAPFTTPFWHEDMGDVPPGFSLIFANEFFDALPIKQYILKEEGWHERGVGQLSQEEGGLQWTDFPCEVPSLGFRPDLHRICEVCPGDGVFAKKIAQRLQENSGAALIIDYGDEVKPWQGETLQALYRHEYVPLEACLHSDRLGLVDMTHHVDFCGLSGFFLEAGLKVQPLMTQGEFLEKQGILLRSQQVLKSLKEDDHENFLAALRRLISPQEMGTLFKVLEIFC